jgi:hypothetical protein
METHEESCHIDLCELETSLLMRGIQTGEMSELGWLLDSLSMPYGQVPYTRVSQ